MRWIADTFRAHVRRARRRRRRARRHRRGASRGLRADQAQLRRAARRERGRSVAACRRFAREHGARAALHRIHGRRHVQWLASRERRAVGGAARPHARALAAARAGSELSRRSRRALRVRRRRRRSRLRQFGQRAVLRRLPSRARVGGRHAVHLPVRRRRATACARSCGRARTSLADRARASCGRAARIATARSRGAATASRRHVEMYLVGG